MATVLIRTFIVYFVFLLAIRLMGKRQIGELQLSELVTTFMISELATSPIQDLSIPIIYSLVPVILLISFEVVISFLITKSTKMKKMFLGNPSFLIKNGELNQKELARLRIGVNELLGELRLKDVYDIKDVDYAILEQNGKLSVFLKTKKQPLSLEDMDIKKKNEGIAHAVIVDRQINESNLARTSKNVAWLNGYLASHKLSIEDIFLMTINDANQVNIIIKEEKTKKGD